MSRISLKEQYDNKDVIQQIYIVKDDQQILDTQMQETQQQVSAMESKVNKASEDATQALEKANSFEGRVSANESSIKANTEDIASLGEELADTQSRVDECIVSLNVNSTEASASLKYMKASEQNLSVAFPIASPTKTGMMNAQTYAGLQNLQDRVNRLEAVATVYYVQFASDDPSQEAITTAFQSISGRPPTSGDYATDIARALTYGYNGSMWIKVEQSSSIPLFSNDAPGLIKGSTEDGTIQAEPNGTGSVNGWDAMVGQMFNVESDIKQLQQTTQTIETSLSGEYQKQPITLSVVISKSEWDLSAKEVTKDVAGVTDSNIVFISPDPISIEIYGKMGVYASSQSSGTLTFKYQKDVIDDVTINVVIF